MFTLLLDGRDAADRLLRFLSIGLAVLALLGGLCLVAALLSPAHAQEDVTGRTFDFGPLVLEILNLVAPALATVVGLFGVWVLKRVAAWLGLKIDDSRRAAIEQVLDRAVSLAIERVGDRARGGIPIAVKHEAIYVAAEYAGRSAPGAIKHFGITAERLNEMVESRLQGILLDPNAPDQVVSRHAFGVLAI